MLDPTIRRRLETKLTELEQAGDLPSRAQLETWYGRFQERFGPPILRDLDGPALLETMHGMGNRDGLVYWLEFKNDDEFPALFGSISGGNALKYGLYRPAGTQTWRTGVATKPVELTEQEAIEIARRHRDQLLRAAAWIEALPANVGDDAYGELQRKLDAECPNISNAAWTHKLLQLWFPDRLDDYHVESYQRFHLIRVLQVPVPQRGRYVNAGRFMHAAREIGVPVTQLTTAMNALNGNPHRYWRLDLSSQGMALDDAWKAMQEGAFAGLGYSELGDLTAWAEGELPRDALKARFDQVYGKAGGPVPEVHGFIRALTDRPKQHLLERDVVVACEGSQVLGVGRVVGDYEYAKNSPMPHRRPVEWVSLARHTWPVNEKAMVCFGKVVEAENQVAIERWMLEAETREEPVAVGRSLPLRGLTARIATALERKGQVILYGPPGTGKTWWARRAARELAARHELGRGYEDLASEDRTRIDGDTEHGAVRLCTFHPAYGYEDFIEGYRPENVDGRMVFTLRDGLFLRLCRDALEAPERRFFLIIDEINRGDVPRIFGELLTALELDKRGSAVLLPVTGRPLRVPANVAIIATMNTADRSIALLDTALRRRFGFVELMPDPTLLDSTVLDGVVLGLWLRALNARIVQHVGRDARNLQIGHAWLMPHGRPVGSLRQLARVLQEDIVPLLEEYCYEDYRTLAQLLGRRLVDEKRQHIRHELFEPERETDLAQALWEICNDVASSPIATHLGQASDEDTEEGEG